MVNIIKKSYKSKNTFFSLLDLSCCYQFLVDSLASFIKPAGIVMSLDQVRGSKKKYVKKVSLTKEDVKKRLRKV